MAPIFGNTQTNPQKGKNRYRAFATPIEVDRALQQSNTGIPDGQGGYPSREVNAAIDAYDQNVALPAMSEDLISPYMDIIPQDFAAGIPSTPMNLDFAPSANRYNNLPGIPNNTPVNKNSSVGSFTDKLLNVESRNGKLPDRPGSQYSGLAQLGTNERAPILKQLGVTDKEYKGSRVIQKQAADIWISGLATRLEKMGIQPTEFNMWTIHNQGGRGVQEILSGDVSASVLANIRNQAGMNKNSTVQDFKDYYGKKFNN